MKKIIFFILVTFSMLQAGEKYLLLAEGNGWFPHMARNLVPNHEYISKLPFSGFIMVGNSYTNLVMERGRKLTYNYLWDEVKGMKNLYPNKKNFLQVNIHFPGDFWDDKAWEQVTKNFKLVAKVALDLGFQGIVFDDEPYSESAKKMINFKFPTLEEVKRHPKKYSSWEKKGAELAWVDKDAYRNRNHTFKEHMAQVTYRFKNIMKAMTSSYPNLDVLVYLGPSLSHENSNSKHPIVINMGLPRQNEYHGAIFTGLKEGLNNSASLHDMGESYKYRTDAHFTHAYQWRKKEIAQNRYNDNLNPNYQWVVPKCDRADWSRRVNVGFMVYNLPQESDHKEFNTLHNSSIFDIGNTLKKALKYSDKYVIYYCEKQDWLLPNQKYPLDKKWMQMMKEVYAQH